jgi:hypothetical protein
VTIPIAEQDTRTPSTIDARGTTTDRKPTNDFTIDGFGVVYNSIGGTPEAFYTTPFGDLDLPTAFVEAVGPTFFEPSLFFQPSLEAATLPAAELPGLAADLPLLLAGL